MAWIKIKTAAECPPCPDCGEPFCQDHNEHYADCPCPGPAQVDDADNWIERADGIYIFSEKDTE